MRNYIHIKEPFIINYQRNRTLNNQPNSAFDLLKNNPCYELLAAEGSEGFIDYIKWLGIGSDPNLVVLSSMHHYYYDIEEMKNVKTVINLIQLNQIKDLKSFLHSIYHILPAKSYFIGCFVDNEKTNVFALNEHTSDSEAVENGIISRIPFLNMIYNLMDSKTNKYMSRRSVNLLLEDHGFKILDMTEFNGLIYFHTQKLQTAGS
ncbi:MAG: hypothetical protein IQL11_08025 [Bacteroidales bacterium]|nr:hypothetical protein [Bacteroidales bacterium]